MLVNAKRKTVRAICDVVSQEVIAFWLGIDPDDIIAVDLSSGQLHIAYNDVEDGVVTPPGAPFMQRRLRITTERTLEKR